MISECRRVGIPDPEFHTDGNSVWVIFPLYPKNCGARPDNYPTVTPQSPHSYPTGGKGVVCNRHTDTFNQRDYVCDRIKGQKVIFLELYLYPAIRQNLVEPIYPENPKHPRQKYRLTDKGKELLI